MIPKKMIQYAVMLVLFLSLIGLTRPAYAGYAQGSWDKLGRGFINLVWFPVEVTKAFEEEIQDGRPYKMFIWAPFEGVTRGLGRALVGAYEVVTFWIPQKPILKPVYTTAGIEEYLREDDDSPT